ncbi:MAG: AI-2E family transporter [Deltaproteobacteria bacterium]|nr:AI-2E family transporter [Deltaproteobacteria bacterium]
MPEPDPPRTDDDTRQILAMVRWLLYIVFAVIGWWVVSYLASVLAIVLVALGIAYLLTPVLDRLVARGVPRALGATGLLVGFLGVVVAVIVILAPRIADEVSNFVSDLPRMVDNAVHWTGEHLGLEVPADWQKYLKGEEFKKLAQEAAGPLQQLMGTVLGSAVSLLEFMGEVLLIPIFAFYFLLDWHHIAARVKKIVPPRNRGHVLEILAEVDDVVAGWVRGQATVTTILAILYAIGFSIVGIHLAIPIGILVGVLTIIPFIGTFIGAAIVLLITLLDWQGFGPLIGVGIVILALHLLEAAVLTPKITGQKVGLSESAALLAVVAGGKLLGFVGVLLAVPIAATVAVLLRHAVRAYEHSTFFGQESDAHVAVTEAMKMILPDPAHAARVEASAPAPVPPIEDEVVP